MNHWQYLVLPSSDLLCNIYIFALCDLTPNLVCLDKATAQTIGIPPNPSFRMELLSIFQSLEGFTTPKTNMSIAFHAIRELTNLINIVSGSSLDFESSWLRQCIIEYQRLVSPFLTISECASGGFYAWEVRREAALFFLYLDENCLSRVSLNDIHNNATLVLERLHSAHPQSALAEAALEYRSKATSLETWRTHSFWCLEHDCALLAGDYRRFYDEPPCCYSFPESSETSDNSDEHDS